MDKIVVYSPNSSNRLKYILDWLLKECLHLDYTITHNDQDAVSIAYGKDIPGGISVPDSGLLWKTGKDTCEIKTGEWNGVPSLFAMDEGAGYSVPFDLFSALFFLLSRYEEYGHHKPDKHNRYPAANSILYKHGWLLRPLADEWVYILRSQLQKQSLAIRVPHFSFRPTYDIDMAYSHIHKGAGRIVGAYMRAFLKGDLRQIAERTKVLKKKQKDPFDSFRWLRQLHREYDAKPLYFILSATKTTTFDKNIHPGHPAMMRVIKNIVRDGTIGIHPSYYSDQGDIIANEKNLLEHISGMRTYISRQHYIKMKMPDTYRLLMKNGINEDYSMGYGSHLGFRAGTGNSFLWYDLEQECVTALRVHPFCFMDTTAHYETKLSAADAFERLNAMSRILEKTGSTLITVFHNFSLGTSGEWKGWRQAYEQFMQEKAVLREVAGN